MEESQILTFILGAIVLLLIFIIVATISVVYARVRVQKTEKDLLESEIAHRKELMKNIVETQEHERAELSSKLHDEVGSKLASIKMILQRHKSAYEVEEYDLLKNSLQDVISTSRDISHNLSSFVLKNVGLVEAAKEIVQNELEKNGFEVGFVEQFDEAKIPYSDKQQMFRILQELIVNTSRYHQGKKQVEVRFLKGIETDSWEFQYIDIGKATPIALKPGFGLNNIENRIEILKAEHEFNFEPKASFSIKIITPYEK